MKKIYRINVENYKQIEPKTRKRILPVLEKETLEWAEKHRKTAHKATLAVKDAFEKNPSNFSGKYFKYLRRLFELKLQEVEREAHKNNVSTAELDSLLAEALQIETLRVPEYLSCTQIGMYEFCPRKWYYRYALGIKFPKTAALHFGSAVDEALNYYFEEKIKGSAPLMSKVHNVFFETFDKDANEVNWGADNASQLRKNGPAIIDAYVASFDRITSATDVQTECRVHLDNGGMLLGFIDILEEDAIVDTKTAKKKWKDSGMYAKHLEELQPKAYSLWFLEHFERMPKEFRYQIVTKETDSSGDAKPETQLISFEVKKFEIEAFRRRVQRIWDEINSILPKGKKAFPAQAEIGNDPGRGIGCKEPGVLCTQEWCDYASLCQKDGLKIPKRWVGRSGNVPGHHEYDE